MRPYLDQPLLENERFVIPRYVDPGMSLVAPFIRDGKPIGVRCTVQVAAGVHARMVNSKFGLDYWFSISDLRIDTQEAK